MHIGCHLSVAGGYRQLCADALQIGADTFQFFKRNPRGGSGRVPSEEELAELGVFLREHKGLLMAHSSNIQLIKDMP